MRTITVYSSSGRDGKSIITDVTTWGSLKEELTNQQVKYDNMKAVVGETKVTLEASNSVLPDGDFTLFLMPKKTKSGLFGKKKDAPTNEIDPKNADYKTLRKFISEQMAINKEAASKHFNEDKHYTNKSTDALRLLVTSWLKKSAKEAPKEKEAETTKEEKPAAEKAAPKAKEKSVAKEEQEPVDQEVEKTCVNMVREIRDDLSAHIAKLDAFLIKHVIKEGGAVPLNEQQKKNLAEKATEIATEFGDIQHH